MAHIFISYSHQDSEYAHKLAQRLVDKGFDVWIDQRIDPGTRWSDEIEEHLNTCGAFVIVMTTHAKDSEWVRNELTWAKDHGKPVFPVLLEGGVWLPLASTQYVAVTEGQLPPDSFYSALAEVLGRETLKKTIHLDEPIELDLLLIDAGLFRLGSNPGTDENAFLAEQPQQRVYLSSFYIARIPVTNAAYAVFAEASGHRYPAHWKDGTMPKGQENHPVRAVSLHDAAAFCGWLTETTGRSFRLPTEEEWEKAARGVDGRLYPWGNKPPSRDLCNFNRHEGKTTPVDRYPKGASPNGVLDMCGNLFEWTSSRWLEDYQAKAEPPAGDIRFYVQRGGSYRLDNRSVRCAYRYKCRGDVISQYCGFRVMLS